MFLVKDIICEKRVRKNMRPKFTMIPDFMSIEINE